MSEVLAPLVSEKGGVNPIEHYYRRISKVPLWTGDILKSIKNDSYFLVITPRCNILKDEHILVSPITIEDFPKATNKDGKDKVGYALSDKPEVAGYNRYLPPAPIFKGGKVLLSNYTMIQRKILESDFEVIITLSDELTNELLGKFGAYFFRTGITPWDKGEVLNFLQPEKKDEKK